MQTQFTRKAGSRRVVGQRLPSRPSRVHTVVTKAKASVDVDIVVVGSGIVGLLTAEAMLRDRLSVAVVERAHTPCKGATGSGQGYIWMAHRMPGSPAWDLAEWSTRQWKSRAQGDAPFRASTQWNETGSLLLATTAAESAELASRHQLLESQGVSARMLTAAEVKAMEPSLSLPAEGAGLLVESDAQIDGREAAFAVLARCKGNSRFRPMMDETVLGISRERNGSPLVVETGNGYVRGRLGVVVAAGAQSGQMLADTTGDGRWAEAVRPRRGHLLEGAQPDGMAPLKHGVMEMSYTKHYVPGVPAASSATDITFTATTSAAGPLLLGSSRELVGYENVPDQHVVDAILDRAGHFMPSIKGLKPEGVRVGLRPYALGGVPIIGPVPGVQGLFVATGHEGSGLTLGPATASLMRHYVTGHPVDVPPARFVEMLPEKRLAHVPEGAGAAPAKKAMAVV